MVSCWQWWEIPSWTNSDLLCLCHLHLLIPAHIECFVSPAWTIQLICITNKALNSLFNWSKVGPSLRSESVLDFSIAACLKCSCMSFNWHMQIWAYHPGFYFLFSGNLCTLGFILNCFYLVLSVWQALYFSELLRPYTPSCSQVSWPTSPECAQD